jgi:hypothetical protein
MAKTILEEAVEDTKLLKETAIENAKNVLVEAISPKIKEFVDSQLGGATNESPMYEAGDEGGFPPPSEEEPSVPSDGGDDMGMGGDAEGDLALLAKLLAKELKGLGGDLGGGAPAGGPVMSLGLGEGAEPVEEGEQVEEEVKVDESKVEENKVEEVVEITDADLKSALSEVLSSMDLKTEATVTKSFGKPQDATLKASGGPGAKGIADEKSGEHQWSDETPPAKKDWTVKEAAYRAKIESLVNELKKVNGENAQYKEACNYLKRNLQEVNLFNSKLLYTQKLLHSAELNNKQRVAVIEAFDRASSLREVELVYKSLSESLKIAGVLGEGKQVQRTMKGPKASRLTTPSSTVLQESVRKEEAGDNFTSRMQELAGLVD